MIGPPYGGLFFSACIARNAHETGRVQNGMGLAWGIKMESPMLETSLALIVFLFPLAYSPGPGNLFFAAYGARFGFAATLPANAGYHLATFVVTLCIGIGFFSVIGHLPGLFRVLKIAGAVYVLWLAWQLARAGVLGSGGDARPAGFVDGMVLLLLNPKAYVIIALMFTQFLPTSGSGQVFSVFLLTSLFTLNNLIAFSVWVLVGDRIGRVFRHPDAARAVNSAFGLLLALVAVWMILS